jgi:pyruvyl transferase EpsO
LSRQRESAADPVVASLSDQIDRVLGAQLDADEPVALVNFPNHTNPGDPAIWLGERRALDRIGVRVRYRASWSSYDPDTLARVHPDGPILINGGGNLGDRYHDQQAVRERVLDDFPGRPVVQLPQSIEFRDRTNLEDMRQRIERHGNVSLLLRDQDSLDLAREHFAAPSTLCPDMAFALRRFDRPHAATVPILWLARRDPEASGYETPVADDVEVTDWWPLPTRWPGQPVAGRLAVEANERLQTVMGRRRRGVSRAWPALAATFDPLARAWVRRGVDIVSRGRVVITDRLHGHVFCLLLGIPHVVLDNETGKVAALYDTFTVDSPLSHLADSPEQALALARRRIRSLDDPA